MFVWLVGGGPLKLHSSTLVETDQTGFADFVGKYNGWFRVIRCQW